MKFIKNIKSVLNEKQVESLTRFIQKQVDLRQIVWEDVVDRYIKDFENLKFDKVEFLQELIEKKISKELQSAFIASMALLYEDSLITQTLSRHEMLYKDDVKSITDKNLETLSIISAQDQRFHARNVRIKNGVLSLIPNKSQNFNPESIEVKYYPSGLEYIIGSAPDTREIRQGTFSGYWLSQVYTSTKINAGAVVTLNYPSVVSINNIEFRSAAALPIKITSLEYWDPEAGEWLAYSLEDEYYGKNINIILPEMLSTTKIRLTVQQDNYKYVFKKELTDAAVIRDCVIGGRDIENVKNKKVMRVIKGQPLELISRKTVDNKYMYEVGAYSINTYLKTFINVDGVYRTQRYEFDAHPMKARIIAKSNDVGSIKYRLVQEDASYVLYDGNIDLTPGVEIPIQKTFFKLETFTDIRSNKVSIARIPDLDETIIVKVGSESATLVDKFTDNDTLQYMVSGRNIFINKGLKDKEVEVRYKHKTATIVLEVILNTYDPYDPDAVQGYSFETPEVYKLDLEIDGVAL